MNKIKNILKNKIFINIVIIGLMFVSLYVLDISIRMYSNKYINVYSWYHYSPNLFTFSWISLFIGILYLFPKKIRNILYLIVVLFFNIIVFAEFLHFKILNRFFAFSDLFLVKEGSSYFKYAFSKTSISMIVLFLVSILFAVAAVFLSKFINAEKKGKKYYLQVVGITILLVTVFRLGAVYKLGNSVDNLSWEAAYNPKNIYIDFNAQGRSLEVSGLYELVFRSTYKYVKNEISFNRKKIIREIDKELVDEKGTHEKNAMTGIIKDKNVIFILMESIDSWLITEDVMPTLYKLKNEGINFTNRYSPSFGGGQTINSEFAVNTGLYSIDNNKAIYNYDKNKYPYSLASMLKKEGYTAVSIHGNVSSFYNRENFHLALGYDKFLGLNSLKEYDSKNTDYLFDTNLIKNDKVYKEIVRKEPFLTFITTYSAHIPYDNTNKICNSNPYGLNVKGDEELSCLRNLARETDEMIKLLVDKLEKDKKLDDTVLIFAADHYAYGYTNENNIKKFKGTNNTYLIQNTPFIVWNNSIKHKDVDTLVDTADILPTIINMLGIEYNPSYYVGEDAFDKDRNNYIYFSPDVFYDGKVLYESNNLTADREKLDEMSKETKEKMKLNKDIIISNYFAGK